MDLWTNDSERGEEQAGEVQIRRALVSKPELT